MLIAWYTTAVCLWLVLLCFCVSPYVAHTDSLPFCANMAQGSCWRGNYPSYWLSFVISTVAGSVFTPFYLKSLHLVINTVSCQKVLLPSKDLASGPLKHPAQVMVSVG